MAKVAGHNVESDEDSEAAGQGRILRSRQLCRKHHYGTGRRE
jgi:hypothetical protein